jgi:hypothetical protein
MNELKPISIISEFNRANNNIVPAKFIIVRANLTIDFFARCIRRILFKKFGIHVIPREKNRFDR